LNFDALVESYALAQEEHARRHGALIEARGAVAPHLRKQADAEIARARWLKRHRGIPSELLYDRTTGDAIDPELVALEVAVAGAEVDVAWCRAVEVACVEELKGMTLEELMARNEANRPRVDEMRARAVALLEEENA
jgi:hypothetical protein